MCGRFVSKKVSQRERYFNISIHQCRLFTDCYNVAPQSYVPVAPRATASASWYRSTGR